ncbi:MAG: ATP-binding protein [Chloroflexales bacterium]|nr:ATP-binding protein [Chloroflexales bacterium]
MNWPQFLFLLLLIFTVGTSVTLAVFVWQHRSRPGAKSLSLLMLAVAVWSLFYTLALVSTDIAVKQIWINAIYFGVVLVPATWLTFAIQYVDQDRWLSARNLGFLAILPIVTILTVWTNDLHGLFRQSFSLNTSGIFTTFDVVFGPAFWVHTAYSYGLFLLGIMLLLRDWWLTPRIYRRQTSIIIVAALIPWLSNVFYVFRFQPLIPLDLTPFAFALSGLLVALCLFHFRLLELAPVARNLIVEQMGEGLIVLNAQNRIVDINQAAARSIACTPREVIGRAADQAFQHQPELLMCYHNAAPNNEIALEKDGGQRFFDMRLTKLNDRANRSVGCLIVLHDITEHKRVENALIQTKEAAESANRAKSVFLANVSHELRTPLTSILGYSELLQRTARDANITSIVDDAERIRAAGLQLLNLVSDLIELSRIEAGQTRLVLETFDIAPFLQNVAATVRPLMDQNQNILDISYDDDLGTMHTDKTRLRQILLNLLDNAAKFTAQGKVFLEAHRETHRQSEWVCISVRDTGAGMTDQQKAHVFQLFGQTEDPIQPTIGGTGLGLELCRYYSQLLGGDISVSSELGIGSTFTVVLPLIASSATIKPLVIDSIAPSIEPPSVIAAESVDQTPESHHHQHHA